MTEGHFRIGRRVVHGSHAVREVGVVFPLFLRTKAEAKITAVRMRVDNTGHDGFTGTIDDGDRFGPFYSLVSIIRHRFDRLDFVLKNHQRAVFNHLLSLTGDNSGIFEDHRPIRFVGFEIQANFKTHRIQCG